jgi:hypothetical protein
MKFGIITINYNRQKVLKLFCASIKRLRNDVNIHFPVVCVSGMEDRQICEEYNIAHIYQDNKPATAKWDTAMSYMQKEQVDFVIIMGSDDIMSTECLRNIMSEMQHDTDLIGLQSMYVYCAEGKSKGCLKHITTRGIFGVGKTINKRVLDKVDWKPWSVSVPRSSGMDAVAARNIAEHVKTRVFVGGTIVDVKTHDSLNKFSMFERNGHGTNVDNSIFYKIMGEEEKQILADIENNSQFGKTFGV